MVEDGPFLSTRRFAVPEHELDCLVQLVWLQRGIHPSAIQSSGVVVGQHTHPDSRAVPARPGYDLLSGLLVGVPLFVEGVVLLLDSRPLGSKGLIVRCFMDM